MKFFFFLFFFSNLALPLSGINLFQLAQSIEPIIQDNNLDYLQHLPRFLENQKTQSTQMNLLTKFLIEDEEILKDNNGIYDETGRDGVDKDEESFPLNSDERNDQRARSAVMLWVKQNPEFKHYEAYGSTKNEEKLEGWLVLNVLLMDSQGNHILKKVCLSKNEDFISFVLNIQDNCKEKAKIAENFHEKSKNFYPTHSKSFAGCFTIHNFI